MHAAVGYPAHHGENDSVTAPRACVLAKRITTVILEREFVDPSQEMEKRMSRIFYSIILGLLLNSSLAFAQLGPKDGANWAPTDLERIKVGVPAPDFTLEDVNGKNISLSEFRGKKSVVLVFYRGYW